MELSRLDRACCECLDSYLITSMADSISKSSNLVIASLAAVNLLDLIRGVKHGNLN